MVRGFGQVLIRRSLGHQARRLDSSQEAIGELLKVAKRETGVIRAGGRCADGWCRERLETSSGTMGSSSVNGRGKQEK